MALAFPHFERLAIVVAGLVTKSATFAAGAGDAGLVTFNARVRDTAW
jgi:hypothetical protein